MEPGLMMREPPLFYKLNAAGTEWVQVDEKIYAADGTTADANEFDYFSGFKGGMAVACNTCVVGASFYDEGAEDSGRAWAFNLTDILADD